MNILPKKRWHVRTKENIARVRKDEAEAAEREKETQRRILLAEKESRTALLRNKARERYNNGVPEGSNEEPTSSSGGHVNFFEDIEKGIKDYGINIEHEKEKKEEREKYEKSIGYLTYLGQNTVEVTGEISWYNKVPDRMTSLEEDEKMAKIQMKKQLSDPLNEMCKYLRMKESGSSEGLKPLPISSPSSHKRKIMDKEEVSIRKKKKKESRDRERKRRKEKRRHKRKKGRKESTSECENSDQSTDERDKQKEKLERLRMERLKREAVEAEKARAVIAKAKGEPIEDRKPENNLLFPPQKYNSQFNPHLARQNFSKADVFFVQAGQ